MTLDPSAHETAVQHLIATDTARIHVGRARSPATEALIRAAGLLGFRTYTLDASGIDSSARLFEALARLMSFPPEFGSNWDALLDYIGDLSWEPAPGYLLVIENPRALLDATPKDFMHLIKVTAQAAADWAHDRIPFHVLVVGDERVAEAITRGRFTLARPDQYPLLTIAKVCDERDRD